MSTPLNSIESYNKLNSISTDDVAAPELTDDGDWGPPIRAFMQNVNDLWNMTNGQTIIGKSAVASLADPTLTPTATTDSSGAIPAGSYDLKFTLTDDYGQTLGSSAQHFNFASTNNRIHTPLITLPTGATGVKWYLSDADGSAILRYVGTSNGAQIYISALPSSLNDPIPTANTTGSANHPIRATPTAGTGLQVEVGAGTFSYLYSPTGNVDQNGFQMLRFCLENINNVDLPTLTTADKGRMVFVPDIPTVKIWNGTGWDPVGGTLLGAAGGDLTSNYPNPTVAALQGRPVSNVTPSTGQFLGWNGSAWVPTSATVSANATQLRGRNISTTAPAVNQVLGWDGTSWVPVTVANANGGTVGGISVVGSPSVDQVLKYNGSAWVPADVVAATGNASSIGGFNVDTVTPSDMDVLTWNAGTSLWSPHAGRLGGREVATTAPTDGQAMVWNNAANTWGPGTAGGGGGSSTWAGCRLGFSGGAPTPSAATWASLSFTAKDFEEGATFTTPTGPWTYITIPTGKAGIYRISYGLTPTGIADAAMTGYCAAYVSYSFTNGASGSSYYNYLRAGSLTTSGAKVWPHFEGECMIPLNEGSTVGIGFYSSDDACTFSGDGYFVVEYVSTYSGSYPPPPGG